MMNDTGSSLPFDLVNFGGTVKIFSNFESAMSEPIIDPSWCRHPSSEQLTI